MAITIRQWVQGLSTTSNNAPAATSGTLASAAVAGNLLVYCLAGDKNTGTLTMTGTGWTQHVSQPGAEGSLYIASKTAVGGETTVTGTTSTVSVSGNTCVVVELESDSSAPWALLSSVNPALNTANRASAASGTTSPATPGEGRAIAAAMYDSINTLTGTPTFSGYTRLNTPTDVPGSGGGNAGCFAAHATVAAGGTTSTTFATNGGSDAISLAIVVFGHDIVPIGPVTDSGPGVDAPTVDKTEIRTLTEAAPSADPATVLADHDALTDSGASVETITIEQLTSISISDAGGVGADTVAVADFIGNDLVEAAPGVDTISLVQTNFVDLTDSGPGVDTTTLLQELNVVADSGAGSDVLIGLAVPQMSDSGVGVDEISIVVIPFTAVLPLVEGTIYDLVVVARVPQASGPPTFIEVDPIEWKSLTYSNTLKEPQELSASCLISSVPESIWQRLRALHELATELWLYRNGERVFAGPLQGWQTSGEDLQLSCKGLMQYLRSMVVHTNQVFTNVDQSTVVKTLVDQWQNLAYGNFGIDTSQITPSGQLRTVTYLRDELHIVGARVEELGKLTTGFDAEIDPATRELLLWSPLKGVDRATGEDAIIFDARNITSGDILCSVAGGDLASEAYGNAGSAGTDEALFSMASNDELRARYGRTGVTGSWSNEKSQAALDAYVQGLLDARAEVLLVPGPRCRVTPDADLAAYAVGDSISYDLAEQLGINQAFRIRKQTVTVSSTGQESVDLEFV